MNLEHYDTEFTTQEYNVICHLENSAFVSLSNVSSFFLITPISSLFLHILNCFCYIFINVIVFFFVIFFMPAPVVYGNSWARDQIRAAAGAYTTAIPTSDLNCICDLH